MKRGILLLTLALLIVPFISADILVTEKPSNFYNLGDTIKIPVKITTLESINYQLFTIELLCNGLQSEVYREYLSLEKNQEKDITPTIPLIRRFIGEGLGECSIQYTLLNNDQITTKPFRISNSINKIEILTKESLFAPGEDLTIEGNAQKENGINVNGFIQAKIAHEETPEQILEITDTIKNGYFYLKIPLDNSSKAGVNTITLTIYEKDIEGNITNTGTLEYNIEIKQIPTKLKIEYETTEVMPGKNAKIKAILTDQTGEKISSDVKIIVRDNNDIELEEKTLKTGEFLELPIKYNQIPSNFSVKAISKKQIAESTFLIKENPEIKIDHANKTIVITNIGNVPYNDSISLKIGENPMKLNVTLGVDQSKKYLLSAPDGEYEVEINGEKRMVMLTGRAVSIKESSPLGILRSVFVWIFIIGVLGLVAFMFLKKLHKKSFFTRQRRYPKEKSKIITLGRDKDYLTKQKEKHYLVHSKNRAELSLSIKGERQPTDIVCIKIKNGDELKKTNALENLQKITREAEQENALIYENQNHIFMILAPISTRTFQNTKTAINLAQTAKQSLLEHNRMFKNKIEFGISVTEGEIVVTRMPEGNYKFMSIGSLIGTAKKLSGISDKEVFVTEKIKEKSIKDVRTEREDIEGVTAYAVKEVKKTNEDNKKFINDFLKRLED